MSKQIITFPTDVPAIKDKRVLEKAKEAIVMELLRSGKISQGKAAELLEITRQVLFDLMVNYKIPVIEMTPEELKKELDKAKEFFQDR